MRTANLNRRIQIQSQTTSALPSGQPQQTWNPVYDCWAEIDVVSGQLTYATSEFASKATHQITIRWIPSPVLAPNMRIVHVEPYTGVTHIFNVEAILNPKQANFWMQFLCYELNAEE